MTYILDERKQSIRVNCSVFHSYNKFIHIFGVIQFSSITKYCVIHLNLKDQFLTFENLICQIN